MFIICASLIILNQGGSFLQSLSEELVYYILGFLDHKSLNQFSYVARIWKYVLICYEYHELTVKLFASERANDPMIWKTLSACSFGVPANILYLPHRSDDAEWKKIYYSINGMYSCSD